MYSLEQQVWTIIPNDKGGWSVDRHPNGELSRFPDVGGEVVSDAIRAATKLADVERCDVTQVVQHGNEIILIVTPRSRHMG